MAKNPGHVPAFLIALLFLMSPDPAYARSVNVQTLSPPYNLVYGTMESALSDPTELFREDQKPVWFLSANYNLVQNPLVELNAAHDQRLSILVDRIQTLDLSGGGWVLPWLSFYAQVPLHVVKLNAREDVTAMGDVRLNAKAQLNDSKDPVVFSLIPEARLPTGDTKRFVSDSSAGFGVLLAIEKRWESLSVVLNGGYRSAPDAVYQDLDYSQRFPLGVGIAIPVSTKWSINADFGGAIAGPTRYQNPTELYGGLNFHPEQHYAMFAGLSTGHLNGVSAIDYRVQAGFRIIGITGKEKEAPLPEPMPIAEPNAPPPPPQKVVRYTTREIQVLEEVKFKHDSSELTPRAKEILDEVADVIKEYRKNIKKLEIQGHTNWIGSYAYNDRLSDRRAASVKRYLIRRKIPTTLLVSKGYGKRVPKKYPKGTSEEARLAGDRRVEFHILESKATTESVPNPEAEWE